MSNEQPYQIEGKFVLDKDATATAFFSDNSVNKDDFNEVKDDVKSLKEKLFEVKNPVQFIFINKSLKMNPGKAAAQVAHAQEEITWEILTSDDEKKIEEYKKFLRTNPRTTIILQVSDTDELYKVNCYLESCDILTGIYVDEKGKNYLLEPTALATEYLDKTDERIQLIFKNFELYNYEETNAADILRWIWSTHNTDFFAYKVLKDLKACYEKLEADED